VVDGWAEAAREWLATEDEAPVDGPHLLLRAALLLLVGWLFLRLLAAPMGGYDVPILEMVNLVFHEAGHILFIPFGSFMTSLGGSLTQVLIPLACAAAFHGKADRFAAALGVWWAGQSLVDLAPYVADARALQLVLLGGRTGAEVEGHDWEAILGALGWLNHDVALGRACRLLGLAVMLGAIGWAAWTLRAQHARFRESSD
jgi:hypothetical protein